MGGISGIYSYDGKIPSEGLDDIIAKMLKEIVHRAPYNSVHHPDDGIVFGMMHHDQSDTVAYDENRRLAVIVDGWIYNSTAQEKDSLHAMSDAEAILELYSRYGTEFLDRIDGSYAIAVWDAGEKKLLLARDRLGYKPIFYSRCGGAVLFASEIKSIAASGLYSGSVDLCALNDFLSYGYVPNPETLFEGVSLVRPGCYVVFQDGDVTEKAYWKFRYQSPDRQYSESEYFEKFIELLKTAVARRLKKHSNCGSFLSGGLDTSGVVAIMHNLLGPSFKVFTAGFEEEQFNEIPDAGIVADHMGLEHLSVTIKFQNDLNELLKKIVWHHDAPFSDTSAIPSYFAAQYAKEHVPAVLTGDFPDQLIGGSGHHVAFLARLQSDPLVHRMLRNKILNRFVAGLGFSAGSTSHFDRIKRMLYRETFSLEEQRIVLNMPVPDLLKRWLYSPELLEVNLKKNPLRWARSLYAEVEKYDLLDKLLYFDSLSYAPDDLMVKVERMTTAHGLIAVSPFHDLDFVEFIARIPSDMKIRNGSTKYIMREALRPFLPEHTMLKKKKGFDMPLDEWLVKHSGEYVRDILLDSRSLGRGYFDRRRLTDMVERFLAGKTDYASGSAMTIISLITLELWHQLFMDKA